MDYTRFPPYFKFFECDKTVGTGRPLLAGPRLLDIMLKRVMLPSRLFQVAAVISATQVSEDAPWAVVRVRVLIGVAWADGYTRRGRVMPLFLFFFTGAGRGAVVKVSVIHILRASLYLEYTVPSESTGSPR
jgi:hypothetical protein